MATLALSLARLGASPALHFTGGVKTAKLTATCEGSNAGVIAMAPTMFTAHEVESSSQEVTLKFINVPPSCADVPLLTPCANDSSIDPALFW